MRKSFLYFALVPRFHSSFVAGGILMARQLTLCLGCVAGFTDVSDPRAGPNFTIMLPAFPFFLLRFFKKRICYKRSCSSFLLFLDW